MPSTIQLARGGDPGCSCGAAGATTGEACEAGSLNNASFLGLKRVAARQKQRLRVEVQHQEKPESAALDASPLASGGRDGGTCRRRGERRRRSGEGGGRREDTRRYDVSQHADRQSDRCLPAPICQQLCPRALARICWRFLLLHQHHDSTFPALQLARKVKSNHIKLIFYLFFWQKLYLYI